MFFHTSLEIQKRKQNNLKNALSKSSLKIYILVEELSNCYDYFLRLLGFPNLFGKVFLITLKFSYCDVSTTFFARAK